jgi:hypothetical protein
MDASQPPRRVPEGAPLSPRARRVAHALLDDRSPGSLLSVVKANVERTFGGIREMIVTLAISPEGDAIARDASGRFLLLPALMAHMAAHGLEVPGVPPLDPRGGEAAARATHAALTALEPDAFRAALREMRRFHEAAMRAHRARRVRRRRRAAARRGEAARRRGRGRCEGGAVRRACARVD